MNRLNTAASRALAPAPRFAEEPTDENALAFSCQVPPPSRTEKRDVRGKNKGRTIDTLMVFLVTLTISRFGGAGGEFGISPSSATGG